MKNIILIILSLVMCGFAFAQSPSFHLDKVKEIKLLESSRDDVMKILADNSLIVYDGLHYQNFSMEKEMIHVSYSNGKCSENSGETYASEDWNVPEWMATEIAVTPKESISIKDMELTTQNFTKKKRNYTITEKKHTLTTIKIWELQFWLTAKELKQFT